MGLFSRFENKVEDTVDNAADKVFDSPISPLQICKRAEKQMKREKMVGSGKQFAPTLYTVLVNPDDDDRLFGYYPTLAGEVETYINAKAQENGLLMDGQPLVRFIVDEGLRSGKFDIVAELVAAPIIEELRDEEMERYGLNAAGPQGGYSGERHQTYDNMQPQGGYPNEDRYNQFQGYGNEPPYDDAYVNESYDAPYGDAGPYNHPEANAAEEALPAAQKQPKQNQALPAGNFSAQPAPDQPQPQQASEPTPNQVPGQIPSAYDAGQGQAAMFAAGVAAGQVALKPQIPEKQPIPEAAPVNQTNFANQNQYEEHPEAIPQNGAWGNYPPYGSQQADFAQQPVYGQPPYENPYSQMNPYGQPMPYDPQSFYGQPMYGQPYPYMQGQPMPSQSFNGMPNMMGGMDQAMYAGAMVAGASQAFQQNIIPNTMIFNPAAIQDAAQAHNSGQHTRARLLDRVNQRTYTLSGNRVVLGRETSCNVVVNDINASRRHADITKDEMGYWVLADLQSTNGTFVNGRPIVSYRLREGDLITVGMTTLVFTFN